jgi:predicted acylesterase/phospholipase RssA
MAMPRSPVPEALVEKAKPLDLGDVRFFGDAPIKDLPRLLEAEAPLVRARLEAEAAKGRPLVHRYLALSGGADNGAFGAGLLAGWSASGRRPEFQMVTGVSAGALIAPFAYLGPAWDGTLREIFTTYDKQDILRTNVLTGLFGGPAVADPGPLAGLIARYADRKLLSAIARERRKGRLLLIGTTNLDAQRPVFWDVGRIAASRHPDALELFRKVLLASASVPGLFPPVRFQVTVNGREFEELHVDGGATKEVFIAPAQFSFAEVDKALGIAPARELYIVRNGKIAPEFKATDETAVAVASRSFETLLKNQSIGDLYRLYAIAVRDGIGYNLVAVPASFKLKYPGPFDRTYMRALFDEGYRLGRVPIRWEKRPPGLE